MRVTTARSKCCRCKCIKSFFAQCKVASSHFLAFYMTEHLIYLISIQFSFKFLYSKRSGTTLFSGNVD